MNYCLKCYNNKDLPLHIKFEQCSKFNTKNFLCNTYKKYLNKKVYVQNTLNNDENLNTNINKESIHLQDNLLIINLKNIKNIKNINYLKSKIKYIEQDIIQILKNFDNDYDDYNIDIYKFINDLVDE